jgi:hypothetical protein
MTRQFPPLTLASALALCVLSILLQTGCKAKMSNTPPPDDGEEDLRPMVSACENMKCDNPQALCCNDEPCVDVQTDRANCGACGKLCSGQELCQGGRCVCTGGGGSSCSGGFTCCPSGCRNLDTDTANCGACNRSCRQNETCVSGACKCAGMAGCSGSQTCCSTGCADTSNDPNNCGMCGKKCMPGKACKAGVCEGECTGCAMGETCCNGTCANLLNNPMNCGMCGKVCPPPFPGIPPGCLFGNCVKLGNADGGADM